MNKAVDVMNPIALHEAGFDILVKELGAVGAVRFCQLFDKGNGDYTKEKHQREEPSIEDIIAQARAIDSQRQAN